MLRFNIKERRENGQTSMDNTPIDCVRGAVEEKAGFFPSDFFPCRSVGAPRASTRTLYSLGAGVSLLKVCDARVGPRGCNG